MPEARFRFYAELNDFLPPERRYLEFPHRFAEGATVKDRVEALGVPHTEIDLILVNRDSVDFAWRLSDGDRVSVYPVFEAFDIAGLTRLRPEPLRDPRFVLDTHLGKLAAYLRMLGFDVRYGNRTADEELAEISRAERRILLTRDVGLLKRAAVTHGYFVRHTAARAQVHEIVARFQLARLARPFTRCMRCNGVLQAVDRRDVAAQLPPQAAALHEEFHRCPDCGRVYWRGDHYRRMQELVDRAIGQS